MNQDHSLGPKGRQTIALASLIYAAIVLSLALMARLAMADSNEIQDTSVEVLALDR